MPDFQLVWPCTVTCQCTLLAFCACLWVLCLCFRSVRETRLRNGNLCKVEITPIYNANNGASFILVGHASRRHCVLTDYMYSVRDIKVCNLWQRFSFLRNIFSK